MLLVVPVAAAVAAISFTDIAVLVWAGVAVWGLVNGVLDSVVKAVVTQLVGPDARAAGFGWLALVRGVGLLAAGAALGMAYQHSARHGRRRGAGVERGRSVCAGQGASSAA